MAAEFDAGGGAEAGGLRGVVPETRDGGGKGIGVVWLEEDAYGVWAFADDFGEAAVVYKLPFASIAGWCNYSTGYTSGWNVGISFGVYLTAPKFLQL